MGKQWKRYFISSSGQFSSVAQSCPTLSIPWIAARQASLSITNSRSSLKLTSIESVMPSSHLILCRRFSSCLQSHPASESFAMSQLFARGGQSSGVSALASFLPKNTQGLSPLEWTGWISLQSKGRSRIFNTTVLKRQFFSTPLSSFQLTHPYVNIGKTIALTRRTFVGKVMSLLFGGLQNHCRWWLQPWN